MAGKFPERIMLLMSVLGSLMAVGWAFGSISSNIRLGKWNPYWWICIHGWRLSPPPWLFHPRIYCVSTAVHYVSWWESLADFSWLARCIYLVILYLFHRSNCTKWKYFYFVFTPIDPSSCIFPRPLCLWSFNFFLARLLIVQTSYSPLSISLYTLLFLSSSLST